MELDGIIFMESSGVVREAFRARGLNFYSCDLQPADDGSPFHFQGEAREVIREHTARFYGFHPTCTFLCGSGLHWNDRGRGWEKTDAALGFALWCMAKLKEVGRGYLENPVGLIGSMIRPPDQVVQPYEFGDDASKATCLWLEGLPRLLPTKRVSGRIVEWEGQRVERWANQTDSGQNRLPPSDDRWKARSKTYPGIAAAMAAQWGTRAEIPLELELTA